jgi:hypothetical protein
MTKLRLNDLFTGRITLIIGALLVIAVWGGSSLPLIRSWNNPHADGFDAIPFFYASFSFLPLGLSALTGAIKGDVSGLERARLHLLISVLLVGLVVLLNIFLWVVNLPR